MKNRDHYYGSRRQDVEKFLKQGKIIFFNCDKVGLKAVEKYCDQNCLSIFISYAKLADIKSRLLHRNPNIEDAELRARLDNARLENFDKRFFNHVLVNRQNELEKTVKRATTIIKKHLKLAKP